jgi:UDP-N-acetylmuramyl pentapeptide phosphotransferase/UDP-N-acetylglucosamine-1-phosphate transferase
MNTKTIVAILLIALGVIAFAYQGITYSTRSEGVNLGPIHMSTEKSHRIPLPPIVGGLALVGGIVLLITDRRRFGGPATS